MKKVVVFFVVLFFVGTFFTPQANLPAQVILKKPLPLPRQNQAVIVAITPRAVSLEPGGKSEVAVVKGKYMETIESVQVIREGREVKDITARLVKPWPMSRKVELQAAANTPVAKGYQLQAIGKAGLREFRIEVPPAMFSLEVVGKKLRQPQQTPLPPQTLTINKPLVITQNIPISPKAEIITFTPKTVSLEPGGKSEVAVVEGKYMETIESVQVIREGREVKDITARLVKPWPASRKIELQAGANAPVAQGYHLRFSGKVGMKEFKIDVPPAVFSLKMGRIGPDIQLIKVELLVFNPGDPHDEVAGYEVNKPIYTHSRLRLVPHFKNIGNSPADLRDVGWKVVEGPLLNKERILPERIALEPGVSDHDLMNYFGPGELAAGTYTIKVMLDNRNKINELSESNNIVAVQFTVQPSSLYSGQPNLKFVGVVPTLINAMCGTMRQRQYTFDATVINAGTFPADIHGNNMIKADSPLTTDYNAGYFITLMPQQQQTIRFTASFPFGISQTLKFYTDKWTQLTESDESDNQFMLTLQVPAIEATELGDLVIQEAYFLNTPTPTTQQYWLVVKIKNLGPASITLCPNLFLFTTVNAPQDLSLAGGTPNYNVTINPGIIYEKFSSAKLSLPSGTFTINIKLDPSDLIMETNETNNEFSFTVTLPQDIRMRQ